MDLIDRRFRVHPLRYVFQSLLAAVAVTIVLLLVDAVAHTVLIAAVGASAFIAFTMPSAKVSRPRYLIGGYVVGVLVGTLFGLLHWLAYEKAGLELLGGKSVGFVLCGGLAVGMSTFVMLITRTAHPPAAGAALGLVLQQEWVAKPRILVMILLAVVALCLVKFLLRPTLKNLL